jgi:O-palmitoleoyl-L-serine hydrolase
MKPESRDGLRFMGSLIVKQVIADLIPLGLDNSDDLLLAGSSAGGLGVMLNLDKVATFLVEEKGRRVVLIYRDTIS